MEHRLQPLLLLAGVVLSSCSVPQSRNLGALIQHEKVCFRKTPEIRLTKAFKPGLLSGYQWDLQVLTDWHRTGVGVPNWWNLTSPAIDLSENNNSPRGKGEVVDAALATHVSRGRVITRWDFENGDRIEIYGTAHFSFGDLNFRYHKLGSVPFDPQAVADSIFQQCGN